LITDNVASAFIADESVLPKDPPSKRRIDIVTIIAYIIVEVPGGSE